MNNRPSLYQLQQHFDAAADRARFVALRNAARRAATPDPHERWAPLGCALVALALFGFALVTP